MVVSFVGELIRSKFRDEEAEYPPDILNIELTNKCNFSCDYCPVPKLDTEKG